MSRQGQEYPALVVVSDLHRRVTGVSATIRNLIPIQRSQFHLRLWSKLPPAGQQPTSAWQLYKALRRRPTDRDFHLWHVRRNNEMQWALFFKHVLRCPIKIVFTSAAIRRHSAFPRWLISQMDAVIATSDKAASYVDNVQAVVGHGVDVDRFKATSSRQEALARLGVEFSHAIGQFGRIRPEKGCDYFVETMIDLLPRHPEWGAILVGKTTPPFVAFQEKLQAQIAAAGLTQRIVWLGEIPNEQIARIYNAMSIVVAPSRYEGFGLTPIEAMATGAPVVAADTGAYAQMIDQGQTGYVFPVGEMQAFNRHLEELVSHPTRLAAMAHRCREKVVSEFSIQKEADGIAEVYQQLWAA